MMEVVEDTSHVIQKEGGSALEIALHPLILINISDHYTRARVEGRLSSDDSRVIGVLFGQQNGRKIEIFNSFEIVFDEIDGAVIIEPEYLKTKEEQLKKVFPDYDVLGWYSTGTHSRRSDLEIHNQFMEFNESPLFLLLDTVAAKVNTKGLPITIFESELRMVNDEPTLLFAKVPYKIETGEAERISVDHVAHLSAGGNEGSQLTAHLIGIHNAIKMLHSKIKILTEFVKLSSEGSLPFDHSLLREIAALCNLLPAIDTRSFKEDFINEYNDALLVTYLATITKGASVINDLVERYNTAYDRHRRRGFGFI